MPIGLYFVYGAVIALCIATLVWLRKTDIEEEAEFQARWERKQAKKAARKLRKQQQLTAQRPQSNEG